MAKRKAGAKLRQPDFAAAGAALDAAAQGGAAESLKAAQQPAAREPDAAGPAAADAPAGGSRKRQKVAGGRKPVRAAAGQARKAATGTTSGQAAAADDDDGGGAGGGGDGGGAAALAAGGVPPFRNKEKVLLLSSRGITFRYRHLLLDLGQLLPHAKRDAKLDTKAQRNVLNEVADMKGCSSVAFFETRKRKDLYLWLAKAPEGPSVKFHVANVHTMAELKLSGNHLKGSRPVLAFHPAFDTQPHLQLIREMLTQAFATPRRHHKSKPFFDHVINFSLADGRIWLRNYQVVPAADVKKPRPEDVSLVEVGPRACLNPIRVFAGSFGGPVLYENPTYVSPNKVRAMIKAQAAGKYGTKITHRARRRQHVAGNQPPPNPLADVFA